MKVLSLISLLLLYSCTSLTAQLRRTYAPHSVLAAGEWYRIGVTAPGIYKIDVPLLQRIGWYRDGLPSSVVQLFGTGGAMLPEANSTPRPDDLPEIALQAGDGGDGILQSGDYLLFYAPGPHTWRYDSLSRTFSHQYHLYTDTVWYYLHTGSNGLRIPTDTIPAVTGTPVTAWDYHDFYEKDSLNLLNSGKQWWGPVFGNAPGYRRNHRISFNLPATATDIRIVMRAAARSGSGSHISVGVNGTAAGSMYLLPVTDNIFEGLATAATGRFDAAINSRQAAIDLTFEAGDAGATAWLDYLEIHARCAPVRPPGQPLVFRDATGTGPGQYARFALYNRDAPTQIWDITQPGRPVAVPARQEGDSLLFVRAAGQLKEYLAFTAPEAQTPITGGAVANQDLHGTDAADLLIVTVPSLLPAAARLAAFHAGTGLSVQTVTTTQVYHEFSSGVPDPVAIRDALKMWYDRGRAPRYLLLFGAASYNYKDRRPLVPSWQSDASLDQLNSCVSDDFFGFLDDAEDINERGMINQLDLGIGRLPARNAAEAAAMVDKIIAYHEPAAKGIWKSHITFVADDGDHDLHLRDAEAVSTAAAKAAPWLQVHKLYLDAYPSVNDGRGEKQPAVNAAIATGMHRGNLIWNYTGHGNSSRLAEESVVDAASIREWDNENKWPLLMAATCDVAPFDDPAVTSIGSKMLLEKRGGAIALMGTTRSVLANANRELGINYYRAALTRGTDGRYAALGDAVRQAKNLTYLQGSDVSNNRKFQLLGDPAMTLAFPQHRVVTDSISGKPLPVTLQANGEYVISGHMEDATGSRLDNFDGILTTTVFAAPQKVQSRENTPYTLHNRILFRGTQTVRNGRFTCRFRMPSDIGEAAAGTIQYYVANLQEEGTGYCDDIFISGRAAQTPSDHEGPVLQAWLNDISFRNGAVTDENPVLWLQLADSSGINISGVDSAHHLSALLDGREYFILNDYFEASLDNFRKGTVRFPFRELPEGPHQLTVKAWDTYNNPVMSQLYFTVGRSATLTAVSAYNYPNPFHDFTRFVFFHNQQNQVLEVILQVFTSTGQQVRKMKDTINATGNRFDGLRWDGRGDTGAKLSPGIYFYNLTIRNGKKTKVLGGKLILL